VFNVGWGEMLVVMVVVLLVFGPNRLPEIARTMGKFIRNFQDETSRALDDLKQGIEPQTTGVFDHPDAEAVTQEASEMVPFTSPAAMAAMPAKARATPRRKTPTRGATTRRKPATKARTKAATRSNPAATKPGGKSPAGKSAPKRKKR